MNIFLLLFSLGTACTKHVKPLLEDEESFEGQNEGDCSDGLDNDGDNLIDCDDSGCMEACEDTG